MNLDTAAVTAALADAGVKIPVLGLNETNWGWRLDLSGCRWVDFGPTDPSHPEYDPARAGWVDATLVSGEAETYIGGPSIQHVAAEIARLVKDQKIATRGTTMDTRLMIIDKTGNAQPTTIAKDRVADTLLGWYHDAPSDVTEAVAELQAALDRGESTYELEDYLSIEITRQPS